MKNKAVFYPERMKKIKVPMGYIQMFLKTFTFLEDEGFPILVFPLGDKGGDRSFTSGGSS